MVDPFGLFLGRACPDLVFEIYHVGAEQSQAFCFTLSCKIPSVTSDPNDAIH